ncbi:MAG: hypothetical protein C4522_12875 [Desulfobacteraceae bacterium]|nr:MAG: hypothetical protein C4522_12875 [Desulfobacteraceae bacterium]
MTEQSPYYCIEYEFRFENGNTKKFAISLDLQTITLVRKGNEPTPEWTKLEFHQCACCPLEKEQHPYCPIAVNIAELVEEFKNEISSDHCVAICKTPERTYMKDAAIQEGLFSIFGIVMATSNCPVMNFFKPMARFHLPFSTIEETIFRSASIYLLRQYFEYKKGLIPDLELTKLDQHYEKVQQVNSGILDRTGHIAKKDADKNAIVILNALAQMLSFEISDNLNSLEYLFQK